MQKYLKESARKALGDNPFTVKEEYLAQSPFRCKESFFKEVQENPTRLVTYASAAGQDSFASISRQRSHEFQRLRLMQLQDLAEKPENPLLLRYFEMLLAYHFGTLLEHNAFQRMINRTELKTAKSLNDGNAAEADIRDFLLISLLFGDKDYLYTKEDAENYLALCRRIRHN